MISKFNQVVRHIYHACIKFTILQVYDMKGTEGQWMKKDVILQDQETQAKIMVTLWNDKVNLIQEGDVDKMVLIINIEIHEYNNRKSVKFNQLTVLEVNQLFIYCQL